MQEKPISERLEFLANKLQGMWGRNPDTDLVREAAEALKEQSEEQPKKTRKTRKATQESEEQ